MTLSRREALLGLLTGAVALFGVTSWLSSGTISKWKQTLAERRGLEEQLAVAERWMANRGVWEGKAAEVRKRLPSYATKEEAQSAFQAKLEELRAKHQLTVSKRDTPKEKEAADLLEISVNWDWEGTLDAVVHLLYDLQSGSELMQADQIYIKPAQGKAGGLTGDFTVKYVYARKPRPPEKPAAPRK